MLNDELEDYKDKMKDILKKRKHQVVVRLESNQQLHENILNYLTEKLNLNKKAYFYLKSPLNMKYVFELLSIIPTVKQEKILYPRFTPFF